MDHNLKPASISRVIPKGPEVGFDLNLGSYIDGILHLSIAESLGLGSMEYELVTV